MGESQKIAKVCKSLCILHFFTFLEFRIFLHLPPYTWGGGGVGGGDSGNGFDREPMQLQDEGGSKWSFSRALRPNTRHVAVDLLLQCLVIAHIQASRVSLSDAEGSLFLRRWHRAQVLRDPGAMTLAASCSGQSDHLMEEMEKYVRTAIRMSAMDTHWTPDPDAAPACP